MKKTIRLTESDLVKLVKKALNEADVKTLSDAEKKKFVRGKVPFVKQAFCDTNYGTITKGPYKNKYFCEILKRIRELDPDLDFGDGGVRGNCPDKIIFSTSKLGTFDGWDELYKYFESGKDGSKIVKPLNQDVCGEYYRFKVKLGDGKILELFSEGSVGVYANDTSRGILGTWKFENGKPVISTPLTRKAVGYAETEDDIITGNKILWKGSSNDLVKRIQYEIMLSSEGKVNPGCKKDTDGNFKPATCDGIFGQKTLKGVKQFQIDNGLKDKSGIVGAETWSAMEPYDIDYEGDSFEE